jgi:hypothetical protein
MRRDRMSPVDASAVAVVSELECLSIVPQLTAYRATAEAGMAMIIAPARSRLAHGTMLILLTTSLSVPIAQIDTSVVNLAVKEIGTRLGAGVTALQWGVDAYNLVQSERAPASVDAGRMSLTFIAPNLRGERDRRF